MAIYNNGIGVITPEIRQKIQFLGTNPIKTVADDTVTNWSALGTGVAGYSGDGKVTDKPTTYGMLINNVYYDTVTQIWQGSGADGMWYRRGNSNGWAGSWIKVLDEKTGISMEKLWSNASPTSNFAAQTLNYGVGTNEKLLIKCSVSTTNNSVAEYKDTFFVLVDTSSKAIVSPPVHFNLTSALAFMHRFITVTSSNIQFAAGGYKSANVANDSKTPGNQYLIPLEIYRIKGVQ